MAKKTAQRRTRRPPRARTRAIATPGFASANSLVGEDALENRGAPELADGFYSGPPIVGVGASAGGLEAFSQLLLALPARSDLTFVFVQHLSPQHESVLPALLAARTPLRVVTAAEGMRLERGHVYVIPPNARMGIGADGLHLEPRPFDRSQFTPIDHFLQSLARWARTRAIGIVLSGTASDGAAGLREIKAAGGVAIAQTPDSAKFDGMPRAAIATGVVDLVLTPEEMAEHLGQVVTHPYWADGAGAPERNATASVDQMAEIFTMLRRASGTDFKQYKPATVRRRLLRRMALSRVQNVGDYVTHLKANPPEVAALYHDLLIHVTRFFRDPESFEALAREVFPAITKERDDDSPIRIWVPGCATGEEAYSVAIALMETLGDRAAHLRIQLFATDVSEQTIEQARAGVYPLSVAADVAPDRLKRYFTKVDGSFKLNKALHDACVFARHDLTKDPPFSRLDLIVCRNVLIYLDGALQQRLISVFNYALKPEGYLMLGPAETAGQQQWFSVIDQRWRIYRKQSGASGVAVTYSGDRPAASPRVGVATQSVPRSDGQFIQHEASRVLLQRYCPSGVVVDANLQIVQFRGQTGSFLEAASGDPNLSILKMAREGLLFPLREALQSAARRRRAVRKEGVLVRRNGGWQTVNLEVLPLGTAASGHLLVLFEPVPAHDRKRQGRRQGPRVAPRRETDQRVADLSRELAASRDYLQSMIQELEAANEELQSANEEILSSNEELQSTNEELDTAKEELQSTNEELNTLNEELHSRNEELSRVNSDLLNLLATVDITIVIVGDDMRIRRFTPMAERVLNLIPGDLGRPIGQIKSNLVSEDFEDLIRLTIDTITTQEREVQDRQGKWYSLRVRPYKNVDNRIDGAVLTLVDIGVIKRYRQQIDRSRDSLLSTVALMQEPVVVVDEALRIISANAAFASESGLGDVAAGSHLLEIGRGQWDLAPLRAALLTNPDVEHEITTPVLELRRPDGTGRRVVLHGRRTVFEDHRHWTVLVARDASHG
jgi:two-component system, chemotaxis family, CheB/CheR fusion protein